MRVEFFLDVFELLVDDGGGLIGMMRVELSGIVRSEYLDGFLSFFGCACPYFSGFVEDFFTVLFLVREVSHFKY